MSPTLRLMYGLFGSVVTVLALLGVAAGRLVCGIDGAVAVGLVGVAAASIGLHVVGIAPDHPVPMFVPGI